MSPAAWGVVFAVFSIIGGALLTAVAGFIGAWIASRREHARWLRERRLDAYVRAQGLLDEQLLQEREVEDLRTMLDAIPPDERDGAKAVRIRQRADEAHARNVKRFDESMTTMGVELAPLSVLGPEAVADAVLAVIHAEDRASRDAAQDRLSAAMREALGIRDADSTGPRFGRG